MADRQLTTQEGALRQAALMITSLAMSKLLLLKGPITLTEFTTKAALLALQADFSGYTAGGYSIASWTGPTKAPGGGGLISSSLVNIVIVPPEDPDPIVGNTLYGWWIQDATGNVRQAGVFDPPRPMNEVSDQFPFVEQMVFGKNPTVES